MVRSYIALFAAVAPLAAAAPGSVCSKAPYKAFLQMSAYEPALSFCSSEYPVAPVTVDTTTTVTATVFADATTTATITAPYLNVTTSTVTNNFTAYNTSIYTTTSTTDVTYTTIVDTVTDTITSTSTIGFQVAKRTAMPDSRHAAVANPNKRAAHPPSYSQPPTYEDKSLSRAWEKLTKTYEGCYTTACSCIETPSTTTETCTVTSTTTIDNISTANVTATSTDYTTAYATANATAYYQVNATVTANTTLYIATTTTTTADATATTSATTTDIPCGETVLGPSDGYQILVRCNQTEGSDAATLSTFVAGDFYDCLNAADENFEATSFDFQISTSTCILKRNNGEDFTTTVNDDYVSGCFANNSGCK